jgi:hypothetical protein
MARQDFSLQEAPQALAKLFMVGIEQQARDHALLRQTASAIKPAVRQANT